MKTSSKGRKLITQREGCRLKAYKDTKGIPTIGVGHTSMAGDPEVHLGMTITQTQADEILSRDLASVESAINHYVQVALTQDEFDALASLAFNIGGSAFSKSTIVRRLNDGDKPGAAEAILMWNKPKEIMGRRKQEYDQFRKGGTQPNGGRMNITPHAAKRAGAVTGFGVVGTGLSDAAAQIQPLTDISDILRYVFIALTLAGLGYGAWKWWKE